MRIVVALALVLIASGAPLSQEVCLLFDGDDYIDVQTSPSLMLLPPFSWEAWACPSSLAYGRNPRVLEKGLGFFIYYNNEGGEDLTRVGLFLGSSWTQVEVVGALSEGVWTHIAAVYAGSVLRMYIDGDLAAETVASAEYSSSGSPLKIGGHSADYDYWIGQLDEIRVWSIERSQADIQENMWVQVPTDTPGLAAYWRFEEGNGQIVHDSSGNGNDAYLGAGPEDDPSDPTWVGVGVAAQHSTMSQIKSLY